MISPKVFLTGICALMAILVSPNVNANTSDFTSFQNFLTNDSKAKRILSSEKDGLMEKIADLRDLFVDWKKSHGKNYPSLEDELHRMLVWIENHEYIEKHNKRNPKPKFTLGHNQFSDLRNSEYRQLNKLGEFNKGIPSLSVPKKQVNFMSHMDTKLDQGIMAEFRLLHSTSKDGNLPESLNWVELGAVTPVKNQGHCGACWAFSATGAIEGAKFIRDGVLVSLSEQNLIDCDTNDDHGCEGGLMENAFRFDETSNGLCSEDDYPYNAEDGDTCNSDTCVKVSGTQVESYVDLPEGDLHGLLASITLQPTSIAIQADQIYFQLYQSGVLDNEDCGAEGDIDHGVLAVGYGHDDESGEDYILIKNSWGESWGENGYVRMKKHSASPYGMCAMLRIMTVPVLA